MNRTIVTRNGPEKMSFWSKISKKASKAPEMDP
jgi:hypothetical protein